MIKSVREFNYYGTTETFEPLSEKWLYRGPTEDLRYIYGFASVNIDNTVYIFGGKLYSKDWGYKSIRIPDGLG